MNNNNFVPYKLTESLPLQNSNAIGYDWYYLAPHRLSPLKAGEEGYLPEPYYSVSYNGKYSGFNYKTIKKVRAAWTWEDVRLFFESKGIEYAIVPKHLYGKFVYTITTNAKTREAIEDMEFETYEAAREYAFLHHITKLTISK